VNRLDIDEMKKEITQMALSNSSILCNHLISSRSFRLSEQHLEQNLIAFGWISTNKPVKEKDYIKDPEVVAPD
jgi:hypothetical protein